MIASEALALCRSAGFPPLQGKGHQTIVPAERAQARNLGGTAEAAFRPKAG